MLLSVQACPLGPLPTQECNSLAESTPPPPKRKKTWLTKILRGPEGHSAATTPSPSEQVAQEMDRYLHHPIIDVESFPLEWWKPQEKQFPLLGRLARRYLCICATSVPSERVFSAGGNIFTTSQSSLKPARVDQLVFSGHKFFLYVHVT